MKALCVDTDNFKRLFMSWIVPKNISIEYGEKKIANQENDDVVPHRFEHGLLPSTK